MSLPLPRPPPLRRRRLLHLLPGETVSIRKSRTHIGLSGETHSMRKQNMRPVVKPWTKAKLFLTVSVYADELSLPGIAKTSPPRTKATGNSRCLPTPTTRSNPMESFSTSTTYERVNFHGRAAMQFSERPTARALPQLATLVPGIGARILR